MWHIRRWAAILIQHSLLVLGLLAALILRGVSPVYRIEVQRLWAERIGHLALEPEAFLCIREQQPRTRTKTVFFSHAPVANPFLLKKWRGVLPTGPSCLLAPIFDAGTRWKWLGVKPNDWPWLHFDLRAMDIRPPHIQFTKEEDLRGLDLLRRLGIPDGTPYVCLAVRDSAYLASTYPERDWSYHDYRDSDISTFGQMADYLAQSGYAVLRMGSIVSGQLRSSHPLVVDYANSPLRSDFGDVYLFANCSFCISTSTGMDSLAMLFRRPLGIVNVPTISGVTLGGSLRLVMFKNYHDEMCRRPLSLTDERRARVAQAVRSADFAAAGIQLVDNSEQELLDFAREFVSNLDAPRIQGDIGTLEAEFIRVMDQGSSLDSSTFRVSQSWLRRHAND